MLGTVIVALLATAASYLTTRARYRSIGLEQKFAILREHLAFGAAVAGSLTFVGWCGDEDRPGLPFLDAVGLGATIFVGVGIGCIAAALGPHKNRYRQLLLSAAANGDTQGVLVALKGGAPLETSLEDRWL